MLSKIDDINREASNKLDQNQRSQLGQYLTSAKIAEFMASLFNVPHQKEINLLDAGAGVGSLSIAFLERVLKEESVKAVSVTAYEIDSLLYRYLNENISFYTSSFINKKISFKSTLHNVDFIVYSESEKKLKSRKFLTHVILNPPYKKINNASQHKRLLKNVGIDTGNLYSAFIALSLLQLIRQGELVAIVPRSFCNGKHYESFRKLILKHSAIKQIHLFDSRTSVFRDDGILQENVIVHLVKGAKQGNVKISRSIDDKFEDYEETSYSFPEIVLPSDNQFFINILHQADRSQRKSNQISYTMKEINVDVSTGPVVDFRVKEHLAMEANESMSPLLHPVHFNGTGIDWPKESKKPNSIAVNKATLNMLYPKGHYILVKRFSSKEEKQRIVARVLEPNLSSGEYFGIENHLNVFHWDKQGLSEDLSFGLAAYLNSQMVDAHFRSFNGHTQVNVADLKQLRYPSREVLFELGKWAKKQDEFDPDVIDEKLWSILEN